MKRQVSVFIFYDNVFWYCVYISVDVSLPCYYNVCFPLCTASGKAVFDFESLHANKYGWK